MTSNVKVDRGIVFIISAGDQLVLIAAPDWRTIGIHPCVTVQVDYELGFDQ